MSPVEFILLAAKGAAIGLIGVAVICAAVWIAVRAGLRRERMEGRAMTARYRAWSAWQDGSPDPINYRHLGDAWERAYYHDLAQYTRRTGNEPKL